MSALTDALWRFYDEVIESNTEADGTYILKHCIQIAQEFEKTQPAYPPMKVYEIVNDHSGHSVTEIVVAESLSAAKIQFAKTYDMYDEEAMADCPDEPEPCDPVYDLKNLQGRLLWDSSKPSRGGCIHHYYWEQT